MCVRPQSTYQSKVPAFSHTFSFEKNTISITEFSFSQTLCPLQTCMHFVLSHYLPWHVRYISAVYKHASSSIHQVTILLCILPGIYQLGDEFLKCDHSVTEIKKRLIKMKWHALYFSVKYLCLCIMFVVFDKRVLCWAFSVLRLPMLVSNL